MKLNGSTRNKLGKGSTRRKLAGALVLLLALGLLAGLTVPALALDQAPHQFYGNVTTDGVNPVPEGTEVKAIVRGVETVTYVDAFGRYGDIPNFKVPADDPDTLGIIEGGQNGDTVDFYVGGAHVASYTPFLSGTYNEFDLEAPMDIPPTVVSTLPVNDAMDVDPDAVVSATFSEDIFQGTYFDNIDIVGADGVIPGITDNTLTIAHDDFDQDTTYVVTIPAGAVEDLTGNALEADYTWSFTIGIRVPELEVDSTSPVDGAVDVAVNTVVTATFNEPVIEGTIVFTLDSVSGIKTYSDTTATFTPAADLDYSTIYNASIQASDLAGNPLASTYIWSFTTQGIPGTIDLIEGVNIIPYNGATTSLPEALTNIGPGGGLDVVDIIWARGAWTGGEWLYYDPGIPFGTLSQLEAGRAYIICVTGDCTWELP